MRVGENCRKTLRVFPTKGLRSAARIICPSMTDKFHTGSPRGIFSHAHVARENDLISLPPAGGKLCEAFLTRCPDPRKRGSGLSFCKKGNEGGRGVRPYGCMQGVWEKNPPVTASPCQPPLGKGAEGTGGTDCHSQCAHWLRNDRVFHGVRSKAGRRGYKRCDKTGRRGNQFASSATGASPISPPAGGVEPRPYGV